MEEFFWVCGKIRETVFQEGVDLKWFVKIESGRKYVHIGVGN